MKEEVKEKLKKIGISIVYLFGSGAMGRKTRLSDIDIGVVFKDISSGEDTRVLYSILYETFSEIYRASRIGIVFLQTASLSLQYSVIKEGKILFEEDPLFRVDYEYRIVNQYLDFKPILEFFDHIATERYAET